MRTSVDRIDDIDAQILNLLQKYGRIKRKTIAEKVGLTLPSVSERMRKLEERGILIGYHAVVNGRRLGYDIAAFIRIAIDASIHYEDIVQKLCGFAEVLEVHSVTGQGSHLVKVRTRSTESLERLLSLIQSWPGVVGTRTSIILSSFKETREIQAVAQDYRH